MVAQLTVRSTGAITAPAGWSQIGTTAQDAAGPIEQAVYWHLVDGTEPATITFSWAGGNADASGGIVTYKGVDPFIGFDQGGSAVTSMNSGGTAATGNPAGLAITTTAANEMLQAAYGVANGVTSRRAAARRLVRASGPSPPPAGRRSPPASPTACRRRPAPPGTRPRPG